MGQSFFPLMPFEALLERLRAGDQAAWRHVVDQSRRELTSIVRRILRDGSDADADDVVQATELRAFQCIGKFRGTTREQLRAWLWMIADRHARDRRRKARAAPVPLPDGSDMPERLSTTDATPSKMASREEEAERIKRAIEQLSHDDQVVVRGRLLEDRSHAELAAQLERSEDAVRQLYSRAIKKLESKLRSPDDSQRA